MSSEKSRNNIFLDGDSGTRKACPLNEQDCPVQKQVDQLRSECKRLQDLSRTDPLTGFFNFRHFQSVLTAEMERTRRSGMPTGLLMIDLDHFKQINDTYGHEAGNRTLKWVCGVMLEKIRRIDIPCRFGGEEFAIILPVTQLPQAIRAAERLRRALERNPAILEEASLPVRVTASFGVDVYRGRVRLAPEAFIERADRFLLEAKSNGRNCVRFDQEKARGVPTEVTHEERRALFGKAPAEK